MASKCFSRLLMIPIICAWVFVLSFPNVYALDDTFNITNLTAVPNTGNNAVVLTWENPGGDFNMARVERWETMEGEYWHTLTQTTGNTYTDDNLITYQTYKYRVTAYDSNWDSNEPPEVTVSLDIIPITFIGFNSSGGGYINDDNMDGYYIE